MKLTKDSIDEFDADMAEQSREEMKKEIVTEYQKNTEPSDDFMNSFAKRYKLQIENSLFNDDEDMQALFESMDKLKDSFF